MKLERKTFSDIDKVVRTMPKKKQKPRELIEEFMDSDMVVAEVVDYDYKEATYCAQTISNAIKAMRVNVVVVRRRERVFLIKSIV